MSEMKIAKEIARAVHPVYGGEFPDMGKLMDEVRARIECVAAARLEPVREALAGILKDYVELVSSGDCGSWDVESEEEVKSARAALTLFEEN